MPEYYRVKENVVVTLRNYIGYVGWHDTKSDVKPPIRIIDFGHGRRMTFLPEELAPVMAECFNEDQKLKGDCLAPGCYARAKTRGACQNHYAMLKEQGLLLPSKRHDTD
jgi:hypothetical protein